MVLYCTTGFPTIPTQENGLQRFSDTENDITVSIDTTRNEFWDSGFLISVTEYSGPVLPMMSPKYVR